MKAEAVNPGMDLEALAQLEVAYLEVLEVACLVVAYLEVLEVTYPEVAYLVVLEVTYPEVAKMGVAVFQAHQSYQMKVQNPDHH